MILNDLGVRFKFLSYNKIGLGNLARGSDRFSSFSNGSSIHVRKKTLTIVAMVELESFSKPPLRISFGWGQLNRLFGNWLLR